MVAEPPSTDTPTYAPNAPDAALKLEADVSSNAVEINSAILFISTFVYDLSGVLN